MRNRFSWLVALMVWPGLTLAADLTVQIGPIKVQQGQVLVGIFHSADTFLKTPLQKNVAKAEGANFTTLFKGLEPGDYAVSVHHDVNDNGKMDANVLGIPSEPYGFSNDAMGSMGPPSFNQAKFSVQATGHSLQIKLR